MTISEKLLDFVEKTFIFAGQAYVVLSRSSTWENVNTSTCSMGELLRYNSGTFAEGGCSELVGANRNCCVVINELLKNNG
ncbi:4635_t:CDS:2 [Funneliformis caledonium]|uniref:4635_t:CDS:1 n=1 Tax=Funneliformis caledonium TaxID=1117310 RepID=A0A9N9G822_9GLOM|nr:4635_t:CDS:2 [Funneliformis caledonium]